MDNAMLKHFAKIIFDRTGIVYNDGDEYRILSRLNSLKHDLHLETDSELFNIFKQNVPKVEMDKLLDISTNNETFFFRDEKQFKFLTALMEKKALQGEECNVWSCACSTGQEPYCMLMGAMESPTLSKYSDLIKIEATDLCNSALKKAESGIFSAQEMSRGLNEKVAEKYFSNLDDGTSQVSSIIKKGVHFSKFNLISDDYPINKYDVIFCRNVLIYQNMENRKVILQQIADSLKMGGYLFMGTGESLIGIEVGLTQKIHDGVSYFQKYSSNEEINKELNCG
jgi:chemotaxis protein methyltransferase CheR